jgi:hypothetical protein
MIPLNQVGIPQVVIQGAVYHTLGQQLLINLGCLLISACFIELVGYKYRFRVQAIIRRKIIDCDCQTGEHQYANDRD